MELLLSIVVDGLIYASWLFLVAVGLTLIFGVMKILNVAHGALFAIGAYAAATVVDLYFQTGLPAILSLVAMLLGSVVVAILLGPVVERAILRLFYDRDEVVLLLVTFALFLIFEDLIRIVWGVYSYYVYEPYSLFGNLELGPLYYVGYDFFVIALAVVVGLCVWFSLNRTALGKVVLAVIHDGEVSRAMGVNVKLVYIATFTIGVFLAALGGAFTSPMLAITPSMGVNAIILSFAVVVIGGLGSIEGAAIGAVLVGLARSAAVSVFPELELFMIYAVMALVLVVRPEGLFRQARARRI
jgi:branched-chain amino acid transport system permease protein